LNKNLFDRLSVQNVDRGFLMPLVHDRVILVANPEVIAPFDIPNYKSAEEEGVRLAAVLADEEQRGWICQVSDKASFVHPLGVVPKASSNGIRLIHDHSVPVGSSIRQ
jgi:hypothetical protein